MAVVLGIVFVLIGMRLLLKLVHEIAFFGATLGFIGLYHYHGTVFLNLPVLPMFVLQFSAAAALTWVFFRLIFIFALFPSPIQPLLMQISILVNGNKT